METNEWELGKRVATSGASDVTGRRGSGTPEEVRQRLVTIPADRGPHALPGTPAWWERATQILLQVVESISTAERELPALNRLAHMALEATSADRCAIFVRAPSDSARLIPAAAATRAGGDTQEQWQRFRSMEPIDVESDPDLKTLWQASRPVTLDDAPASPLIPENWKRTWDVKSVAFSAIRARGETYGLLAVDYVTRAHRFSQDEARLLDAIAAAAGTALRSARLVKDLQHVIETERHLSDHTAAIRSHQRLDELLDRVVDGFGSLVAADATGIYLLSADQTAFRLAARRGWVPTGTEPPTDMPVEAMAWATMQWKLNPARPIAISNRARAARHPSLLPEGMRQSLLVPLWDGQDLMGFAAIGHERAPYTPAEIHVAEAFAGHAALAIVQAGLHEALRARLHVIDAFQRLSDTVTRTSTLKRILSSLNRGICKEFGVRCARAAVADDTLVSTLQAHRPTSDEMELIRRWRTGPAKPRLVDGRLALPIPIAGKTTGILWVETSSDADATTTEFLTAIASGLGEVAHKARLRRSSERRARELTVAAERERIARDLHDTVGETFFGIGLKLQDLLADVQDPEVRERLSEIRGLAAQAVSDVRSAVYALSYLHVKARGLRPSLRQLIKQFTRLTAIDAELRTEGLIPRLSEEVVSALYRTAHEALVNVERHARATGVVLKLRASSDEIELTIRDDGVGLDQRHGADWRSAAHFGMRAMAKAVGEVHGRFQISQAHPRGLLITATIPLRRRKDRA